MAATVVGCRSAWLALGGLFVFFFAQICIEKCFFSPWIGGTGGSFQYRWAFAGWKALTTESLLMSVNCHVSSYVYCIPIVSWVPMSGEPYKPAKEGGHSLSVAAFYDERTPIYILLQWLTHCPWIGWSIGWTMMYNGATNLGISSSDTTQHCEW